MPFVIAAVVFVGLLCTLDLVLTVGVIRRLREHTELLANRSAGRLSLGPGEEVGEFTGVSTDGEPLDHTMVDTETVVAFFSPTCGPCKEKLPKFVEYARSVPGGRARVLAAVASDRGDAAAAEPMLAALGPVAKAVGGEDAEALAEACKVQGFPVVLKINRATDGRLLVMTDQVDVDRPAVASV